MMSITVSTSIILMAQSIYEGTWEEIAAYASELKGRRVRLTVLDSVSDEEKIPSSNSLAEVLKGKVGIIEGVSPDLSTHTGEKFADLMQEKQLKRRDLS